MSRSVTFNGITRFRPGGITRINTDALNQVGISANGVIGLIGEADGGAPGTVSGLVSLRDPSKAIELYKEGPLVDAIRLAFESSGDPIIPGGASEVVVYKVNNSTQSSIQIPSDTVNLFSGTVAAGSTTTSVNITAATFTVNQYANRWVKITIAALPGTPTYVRRIVSNTSNAIVVTPALPSAPAATDAVAILSSLYTLTSKDYGAHTAGITHDLSYDSTAQTYQATVSYNGNSQVSESLGGKNFLQLVYLGGANAIAQNTVLTPANTTNTLVDLTTSVTASAHANKTVVITNPATGNSERVRITSNTTSALTLEAPGLSDDFVTEIKGATASTVTVNILTVTNATATVTGASGAATSFATTITGVTGDDLAISITASMTLNQLVNAINANTNYFALVPSNINGDVALAKDFDFGTSTTINIQKDIDRNGGIGLRQDLNEVIKWFNNSCIYASAARTSTASADGGMLPRTTNAVDALFIDPFALVGGTRGMSSNSSWQAAFDELITRKIDYVVPVIDQDLVNEGHGSTATWSSVSAQLASHVTLARGAAGLERGGFIGKRGTKAQIISAANTLNDYDVQLVAQNPTVLNASGTLVEQGPRMLAVMAASMRAGVQEIGEPLTFKYLKASGITQDASWNPSDLTDSADLINAGVLFAESVPGKGIRWVRDLTTWVRTDNLALSEGSVRDVVRFVAYNLRTDLEGRFTGRKATPATIASVKDAAVSILESYRKREIIVDSKDPATGTTVRAYFNLKVYSTGDVLMLKVGIFPVPGINFQLSDIFLQSPTQSA